MKRLAVIYDVDGTLVDVSSVRHHVLAGLQPDGTYKKSKNFDAFHEDAVSCPPHAWVVRTMQVWRDMGYEILIVTARSEKYRRQLDWWLAENGVACDAPPFMRTEGDYRKDYLVKGEILDRILKRWDVRHAYDDNPAILALWEERGIEYTEVPGWQEAA